MHVPLIGVKSLLSEVVHVRQCVFPDVEQVKQE